MQVRYDLFGSDLFAEVTEADGGEQTIKAVIDRDIYAKTPFRMDITFSGGWIEVLFYDDYIARRQQYRHLLYRYKKVIHGNIDFVREVMFAEIDFRTRRTLHWVELAERENTPSYITNYLNSRSPLMWQYPFLFTPTAGSHVNGVIQHTTPFVNLDSYTKVTFPDGKWLSGPYYDADAENDATTPLHMHISNSDLHWFAPLMANYRYSAHSEPLFFAFTNAMYRDGYTTPSGQPDVEGYLAFENLIIIPYASFLWMR